ncbi:PD-(D/E)XK nuclease family protein [Tautonia plasticadhaerens]|uniref:PD-(D/E)XK nuclease superfamily protein n=1 Tax=Tautonia plasticadhaerens TaxID=2527974 RepID=A0A518H9Z0_9BACT|nr:PD-(D/E)XK nuclease family protein [Tautonia plasticadhaerens]QDV37675.1 PD-(D/E)XK nuclease superfamily protein [Tautonia plasticadhaerens]
MASSSTTLPILDPGRPLRLTPTDVSLFVRLEQCERFLRFRLAERAGQDFMEPYGVVPQRISPLLSRSGHTFEKTIEEALARRSRTVHYAVKYALAHNRPENNREVAGEARTLRPGEAVLLFQPRLEAEVEGWRLRGDVDLLKLERDGDGTLHVLLADLKSTAEVKVEHRLQVAFYRLMVERIFRDDGIAHEPITMGVLYRSPADPTPEEQVEIEPRRDAAEGSFGLVEEALLEVVADPDAYVQAASDLVLGSGSTARRVAQAPFEDLPYYYSVSCSGGGSTSPRQ